MGDRLSMVGSHVGHDCQVGNDVTFANNAVLGGHVTVGDFVFFGGQLAVHQFVRVGEGAMLGGMSGVRADVIPFGLVQGESLPISSASMLLACAGAAGRKWRSTGCAGLMRRCFSALALFGNAWKRSQRNTAMTRFLAAVVSFIRAGSRPLTMAIRRAQAEQHLEQGC